MGCKFKNKFSKAKFINILRNPLDNICSLKKLHKVKGEKFLLLRTVFHLKFLYLVSENNYKGIGKENYLFVRYGDLISNPIYEMEKVCKFLNIKPSRIFCRPTMKMKPATSNTMHKEKLAKGKIYQEKFSAWEKELSTVEKVIIVSFLFTLVSRFRYWNNKEINKYYNPFVTFIGDILF